LPDLITVGLAWFFVWLFGVAAVHKLRSPGFYQSLLGSWFPGTPGIKLAGYGAAAAELLVVVALLMPQTRPVGLLASAVLLLAYAVVMGLQLSRGRRGVKCGCAGPASSITISAPLLLRNLVCASLALVALLPAREISAGAAGLGLSLSVAGFLVAGYLNSEQLIANAQRLSGEV
jgi:hypothetical protein